MNPERFNPNRSREAEFNERTKNKVEMRENDVLVTAASEMGGRSHQEDRYVVKRCEAGEEKFLLMAVMDGHGGDAVAEYVAEKLPDLMERFAMEFPDIEEALRAAIRVLEKATSETEAGSTLSVVAIPDKMDRAYVAVLGDSPVIISDREGVLQLSPEHNARTNKEEREAAVVKGAVYEGGYLYGKGRGGLQLARALGDRDMDSFLNREAETYSVALGEKSFVIVASDGVFDPHHDESLEIEAKRFEFFVREGGDAKTLVQDAVERRTRDNATAIVWKPENF